MGMPMPLEDCTIVPIAAFPLHSGVRPAGEVLFFGHGGEFLIGPGHERWDAAMPVRQSSLTSFREFASSQHYLSGIGHRLAALEDSRLLLLVGAQV
jgi:hypothetical protein